MSLSDETSGEAFFPVPPDVYSPEAGTEGFRQEGADQNEDLSQELMEFLEFEPGLEIPWAEIEITRSELDRIPLENESSETKIDDAMLMLEEIDQNDLFQEINQFLDLEELLQIPCEEILNSEQDPAPGPSSGENKKDLNLKENNDLGKEEVQEMVLQRKSSAPSKTGSNNIKREYKRGKCFECNNVYLRIFDHNKNNHNGKLQKCITSGCKNYFASVQKRIEHEQREHTKQRKFCCQFCHYSTEKKYNLERHVRVKHSEKEIKCGQKKCGKMYASEADLRHHVKTCHKMKKCHTCGREMSLGALDQHIWYGRCPGTVAE